MCVFVPKSTMLEMVEATDELIIVMSSTPRKLNTALMMIAGPDADAPGGDGRCDGVRRVRPAVDEDDAQGQQNRDGQDGVRHDLTDEMG